MVGLLLVGRFSRCTMLCSLLLSSRSWLSRSTTASVCSVFSTCVSMVVSRLVRILMLGCAISCLCCSGCVIISWFLVVICSGSSFLVNWSVLVRSFICLVRSWFGACFGG